MKRTNTKIVHVGNIQIGGQNKVIMQSMTNTRTANIIATIKQINDLENAGCQIVRMAVLDESDALAISEIKAGTNIPLVADIHFNYRLALIAIGQGIDKIRLNPGNIGNIEHVQAVVNACTQKNIPIRIGINSGSLDKEILEIYKKPCVEAMIASAKKHIDILEHCGFEQIILSFKSSDVQLTIDTYRAASKKFPYPLHLGVTEAGTFTTSSIKSSAALGPLLHEGIGDTIRISVSADPVEELQICKQLLNCFKLIEHVPNLISCPTCGRLQYNMLPIVKEIEQFLTTIESDVEVAIMGCPVNGPQEASRADIGIAGGKDGAILFKKGTLIKSVPQDQIIETLKQEILLFSKSIK